MVPRESHHALQSHSSLPSLVPTLYACSFPPNRERNLIMEATVLHSVSHNISFCSHHLQALPLSCPQVQPSSNYHSQGQLYSAAQVRSRASLQLLQLVRNMDSSPTLMVLGAALLPAIGGEVHERTATEPALLCSYPQRWLT